MTRTRKPPFRLLTFPTNGPRRKAPPAPVPETTTPAREILAALQRQYDECWHFEQIRPRIDRLVTECDRDRERVLSVLWTIAARTLDGWIAQYSNPTVHVGKEFRRADIGSWCQVGQSWSRLALKAPARAWTPADAAHLLQQIAERLPASKHDTDAPTTYTIQRVSGDTEVIATRGSRRARGHMPSWFYQELSPEATDALAPYVIADTDDAADRTTTTSAVLR